MNKQVKIVTMWSILVLLIDFLIKSIIRFFLEPDSVINIINNFFSIAFRQNTGGAFSILTGHPIVLAIIGIIVIDVLIYFIFKEGIDNTEEILYSLLIGGILGNILDRMLFGYVIDYLEFTFGSYRFPTFNFADICIVVSIFLLVIHMIRGDKDGNKNTGRDGENRPVIRKKKHRKQIKNTETN